MKMRGIWGIVGLLCASGVAGVCACSGSAIDVGPRSGSSGNDGLGGAPGAGGSTHDASACSDLTPLPEWPSTTACAGPNDSPLVGKWHGYVENAAAPWDELFLDIKGANSDGLCGTLTVGNVAPPPPATDPTRAYPPGNRSGQPLIPGHASTLLNGKLDGSRVRFAISSQDGYRGWCQLQTSYVRPEGAGGWGARACSCLPTGSYTVSNSNGECYSTYNTNGVMRTFECDALACGSGLCACNASGCDAPIEDARINYLTNFDLTASGDGLEGSDTAHTGSRIHFARIP
jgi:hypothetical protein